MSQVTLDSGRVADVTLENVDSLVLEQLDAMRQKLGAAAVDGPGGLGASVQEAFYSIAGKAYDTTARTAALATSQSVIDNPLVQASDAVFHSVPDSAQKVWKDTSDATIAAGAATVDAAKRAAKAIGDNLPDWLAKLLAFLQALDSTVKVIAIGGAVVVVGGASIYLVYKFKK